MHFLLYNFYCFVDKYDKALLKNLPKNTSLIYRNYLKKIDIKEILKIKKFCSQNNIKFYLTLNIKESIKLKLDGAYIPSFYKSTQHNSYSLRESFEFLGSAHNLVEIRQKERQQVKNIFLSPIFKTKNNKAMLGIYKFKTLMKLSKAKITCLGGINKSNVKKAKIIGIRNIAGISLFKNL